MNEQLTIQHEIARRQMVEGMGRALDRAEREIPSWGDLALVYIRRYAAQHDEFPGYFVTMTADNDQNFPQPPDDRAWGGVWQRAVKQGIVRDSGKTMRHPRRHGSRAIVWASLIRSAT